MATKNRLNGQYSIALATTTSIQGTLQGYSLPKDVKDAYVKFKTAAKEMEVALRHPLNRKRFIELNKDCDHCNNERYMYDEDESMTYCSKCRNLEYDWR